MPVVLLLASCGGSRSLDVMPRVVPKPPAVVEEPLPTDRRELAKLGLHRFDEKRWDDAIRILTLAADVYPEVASQLRIRIVMAEENRGNAANAAALAAQIVANAPTSSAANVARLRLPALYAESGDMANADLAFQQLASIPIDELTERPFIDTSTRLANAGRHDLADAIRMHLLNDYTQGRYTEELYGLLSAKIDQLSRDEAIALAAKLAKADRYDQALDLLGRIGDTNDDLYRGVRLRALFNSRNYTTLLDETKDAVLTDPALVLLRARAAWRSNQPQEFLAGLARIEKDFPASKEAVDVKVLRAKYSVTDEIDYDRAIADLDTAINSGALGQDGENIWNLGWTYTLAQKYDDALRVFDRYIAAYPDGDWKTNSLFWSAKILDKLGRTTERDAKAQQIVAEFPFSYYAYRVKELWPAITAEMRATPFPTFAPISEPRMTTIEELMAIDLARDAAREAQLLAAEHPDDPGVAFLLADVYSRGGEPFKANGVLQRRFREFVRHGGTNIPKRFWEILFPFPYGDVIRAEAEKRSLDPYLIASIIRQESGFEPLTVSNAGAVGLMQIMPAEASRIATDGGLGTVTREDLFDPAKNIAVGVAEYQQKLQTMDGQQVLAIAAYNAGEDAVRRWLGKTPIEDVDTFVEAIPFAETRLYVKTVTRNRSEYRRIYE
ncbi:MAG TPA: transglycosylase SLT domain-containing protein [Thermoanaerobaculia bacterium]|nr:transglycosylase SLT domain-containing protein [Thermoanaerobaculia bacterium]